MWDAPENYSAGVVPSTWRAVAGCSSALADKIEKDTFGDWRSRNCPTLALKTP
jgi:hypothetical protein